MWLRKSGQHVDGMRYLLLERNLQYRFSDIKRNEIHKGPVKLDL